MTPNFSISILTSSPDLSQFLVITAEPAGVPVGIKSSYQTYRQELRDLPANTTNPRNVIWPEHPE